MSSSHNYYGIDKSIDDRRLGLAIVVNIPLMLAIGVGSEAQRPPTTAAIGGLLSSTFLTFFVCLLLEADIKTKQIHRNNDCYEFQIYKTVTMSGSCDKNCSLNRLRERQRGTLLIVLGINATMFFVIATAALYSDSSALLSDSLDNLGDALTYALSIYAVSRGDIIKARVALFKGWLIFLAACVVIAQIIYKLFVPVVPVFEVMGAFSLLGLTANGICLFLLWRHRDEDVNMSSVWECSRNDIATNLSVFVAAGAVWLTQSGWPDILVASCLAVLLIRSAIRVIVSARVEFHTTT